MVMLVSSVWHGVHPGYYLSLGSVPFCLMVSLMLLLSKIVVMQCIAIGMLCMFVTEAKASVS